MTPEIKQGSEIKKVCGCGQSHNVIPENARAWIDDEATNKIIGYVWECECKSTLFVPTFKISREAA